MNNNITELSFRADLLRECIRSNNLSQHKIAQMMKMTDKTFSEKMNGKTDWKLKEIQLLSKILKSLNVKIIFRL